MIEIRNYGKKNQDNVRWARKVPAGLPRRKPVTARSNHCLVNEGDSNWEIEKMYGLKQ
jgi:hypothetical protein